MDLNSDITELAQDKFRLSLKNYSAESYFLNDMTQSLSELNSKVWYRALKVIYFLFFIIAVILVFGGVYASMTSNDYIYVVCNYGNHKTFTLKDAGYLYLSRDLSQWSDAEKKHIQEMCQISKGEIQKLLSYYEINNAEASKPNHMKKLFEIKNAIETLQGKIHFISYSILFLITVGVFFEIVRRAFYYILIGNLNPKK